MRKVIDDPRLMVRVCDLYYNQGISQQQIAKDLNLSRPTVSRVLALAREQGIVKISISMQWNIGNLSVSLRKSMDFRK